VGHIQRRAATFALTLITATAGLVATDAPANAAGTDIGRVGGGVTCLGVMSLLQRTDPAGATFGTDTPARITSWSTSSSTAYGVQSGTRALQVWRTEGGNMWRLVWESAPQSTNFDGVRSYDVADPFAMQPGDRLGIGQTADYNSECASSGYGGAAFNAYFAPTDVGSEYPFGYDYSGYVINAAAHLDPADSTAPVITPHVSPAVPDGANGWYTSSPTVSFDVTDADSAVTDRSTGCDGGTVIADSPVDGTTFTCIATSAGGSDTKTVTIKRDATAPAASFDDTAAGPADGATYTWGTTPDAPTCTATDALSGPEGCTVTGYSAAVGTHTLTATAKDLAGNTSTATRSYTVAPWRTAGFTKPIDMNGVLNTAKNGSTVPVKFQVYAGDIRVIDPAKVAFSAAKVTCSTGTAEDAVEVTATGATSLRYDSTAGQFVYNWATPKTAGACYALTMTTADGTPTKALFKLK
jgi:hypothetical protein